MVKFAIFKGITLGLSPTGRKGQILGYGAIARGEFWSNGWNGKIVCGLLPERYWKKTGPLRWGLP
ncbi:hypothetical protein D082_26190 [Synechocystis sp. PCC 6714]|nr:hypothetical protein D082_26190 [Synechocystis sp. PCC 6714]